MQKLKVPTSRACLKTSRASFLSCAPCMQEALGAWASPVCTAAVTEENMPWGTRGLWKEASFWLKCQTDMLLWFPKTHEHFLSSLAILYLAGFHKRSGQALSVSSDLLYIVPVAGKTWLTSGEFLLSANVYYLKMETCIENFESSPSSQDWSPSHLLHKLILTQGTFQN